MNAHGRRAVERAEVRGRAGRPAEGRWAVGRRGPRRPRHHRPHEALTLLAGEEELERPMLLTDMDKACARILEAIDKEQTIVVYGD
ncbi:hypothetical protein [Faecalibacterium hattorii]|uniref:hypothetical protein n=1 Tax=Faecalibacterium hattorii TaxID=2935520 RepID=UPI003AAAD906